MAVSRLDARKSGGPSFTVDWQAASKRAVRGNRARRDDKARETELILWTELTRRADKARRIILFFGIVQKYSANISRRKKESAKILISGGFSNINGSDPSWRWVVRLTFAKKRVCAKKSSWQA